MIQMPTVVALLTAQHLPTPYPHLTDRAGVVGFGCRCDLVLGISLAHEEVQLEHCGAQVLVFVDLLGYEDGVDVALYVEVVPK
jgi:hypothetical protein